jgi:hypothetical protein
LTNSQIHEILMNMKEIILQILDEMKDSQINIASESAREYLADKIMEGLDSYIEKLFSQNV